MKEEWIESRHIKFGSEECITCMLKYKCLTNNVFSCQKSNQRETILFNDKWIWKIEKNLKVEF